MPAAIRNVTPFLALAVLCATGCASMGTVRPARVQPGTWIEGGISAGFAWPMLANCLLSGRKTISGDLVGSCKNDGPWGIEGGVTRGIVGDASAYSLGAGMQLVAGEFTPFVEGYRQMRGDDRPWGIGARAGIPTQGWGAHSATLRFDRPRGEASVLSWNPSLLVQHGRADGKGELNGSWIGLANAIGVTRTGERATSTFALHAVVGRARGVHPHAGPADPDCVTCPAPPKRFDGELTASVAVSGSLQFRRGTR